MRICERTCCAGIFNNEPMGYTLTKRIFGTPFLAWRSWRRKHGSEFLELFDDMVMELIRSCGFKCAIGRLWDKTDMTHLAE